MNLKIAIISLVGIVALSSCAMRERNRTVSADGEPIRLTAVVFQPVSGEAAASTAVHHWEDRVSHLKKHSTTVSEKRHSDMEKKISQLDNKLEDARSQVVAMRTGDSGEKKKQLDKVNETLSDITVIYNSVLAE